MLIFADVLRMVLGNTRWVLDFSQYILNEVFDLADEFESVLSDQEAFTQKRKYHFLTYISRSIPLTRC